jgi:hypothetical protein
LVCDAPALLIFVAADDPLQRRSSSAAKPALRSFGSDGVAMANPAKPAERRLALLPVGVGAADISAVRPLHQGAPRPFGSRLRARIERASDDDDTESQRDMEGLPCSEPIAIEQLKHLAPLFRVQLV